jgi:hypothetical protein
MSNALTTIVLATHEICEVRRTASGKETTRGLLGLITSGSKAERLRSADLLVHHQWATGQFKPMAAEFTRIFCNKTAMMYLEAAGVDAITPNKSDMLAIMRSVVTGCSGKVVKGEKALFLSYAVDLLAGQAAFDAKRIVAAAAIAA